MPKTYDPLSHIPSPEVIQRHLRETEQLADRLRILLRVSQEIRTSSALRPETHPDAQEVPCGS